MLTILLSKLRKKLTQNFKNESGFTVLELIIVVVVIGVLALISIPIFASQSKGSIEATLKSDLRNAALTITTEATKTQGRMPAWLPNYATKSPDNVITVVTARSNQYSFCLRAENFNLEGIIYYYSSVTGTLGLDACPSVVNGGVGGNPTVPGGGGGAPLPAPGTPGAGLSFDEQEAIEAPTRKALFVANNFGARESVMRLQLLESGYSEVQNATSTEFVALSDSALNEYSLLVVAWNFNGLMTGSSVINKATAYYDQGGKVLQDGNDNSVGANPFVDTAIVGTSSGDLGYSPTKNTGLSPAFMYTFEAARYFPGDSNWRCVTGLKAGSVSIAEAGWNDNTCIMVYAGTNSNGGRWVATSRFVNLTSGVDKASIDWLKA